MRWSHDASRSLTVGTRARGAGRARTDRRLEPAMTRSGAIRSTNPPFRTPFRRDGGAARAGNARPAAGGTSEETVGASGARGPAPSGGAGPSRPTPEEVDADGPDASSGDEDAETDVESDVESESDRPLAEALDGRRLNFTVQVKGVVLREFEAARAELEEGCTEGPVTEELIVTLLTTVRRAARDDPAMAKKVSLFTRDKEGQLKEKLVTWLVRPPQRGVGPGGGQTAPGQISRRSKAAAMREAKEKAQAAAEERIREMAEERDRRNEEGQRWCAEKRKQVEDLLYGGVGREAGPQRRRARRIEQLMNANDIASHQIDIEYCVQFHHGLEAVFNQVLERRHEFPEVANELASELEAKLERLRDLLPLQLRTPLNLGGTPTPPRGHMLNMNGARLDDGAGAGAGGNAGAGAGEGEGGNAGAGEDEDLGGSTTKRKRNLRRQQTRLVNAIQKATHKLKDLNRQLKAIDGNVGIVEACVVVKQRSGAVEVSHSNENLQAQYRADARVYSEIMDASRKSAPTSAPARTLGSGAALRDVVVVPPYAQQG